MSRLREAGRIAAAARSFGAGLIRPGALLRGVCEAVEDEIGRLGGALAFPVQSSRNAVAAHYCASPEDATTYAEGDLAKLDIGVHVDGWVVDTAVTVNVGDLQENRRLVEATRAALDAAIAVAAPGVAIHQLSVRIETTLRSFGVVPVRNLCGHGVGRWTVHCPPPVPNVGGGPSGVLEEGSVVAIEPFATARSGEVREAGTAEVFRMKEAADDGPYPDVTAAIRGFRGLPFARRQLRGFPREAVEATLSALALSGGLAAYPPLVERDGQGVAQAEHTLYVGAGGAEVLTR